MPGKDHQGNEIITRKTISGKNLKERKAGGKKMKSIAGIS